MVSINFPLRNADRNTHFRLTKLEDYSMTEKRQADSKIELLY